MVSETVGTFPSLSFSSASAELKDTDTVEGTFSIAAVRVQFQSDTTSLTTGEGHFDLGTPAGAIDTLIDPPPHNAAYFSAQLKALDTYYRKVSRGKVTLDLPNSQIFPQAGDQVYTLPEPMVEYGRGFSDSTQQNHWAKLVYHTYQQARSDVEFSLYSTLVIFHAGVGQDFDIQLDESPYDIQSAYLDSEFLQTYLPESQYETLSNAGINHVLILPETQNQLDTRIGLTGTFALLFGSRLGLPSLYNTETGNAVVGVFGLMDLGSNNAQGLAPSYPSAWTRYHAGWQSAKEITRSGTYSIAQPYYDSAHPALLRIPITRDEYYLIENRSRITRNPELERFPLNFDTLYVQRDPGGTGVITSVEHYDAGLPGSGLLIWHVDEGVVRSNINSNTINTNPELFGVDLEEADGAQDIGQDYGLFGGDSESGWRFDMWFAANEGYYHLNPDHQPATDSSIAFTPTSHPSTQTNSGAYSGISVSEISSPDTVMRVQVDLGRSLPGFPVATGSRQIRHFQTATIAGETYLVGAVSGSGGDENLWLGSLSNASVSSRKLAVPRTSSETAEIRDIAIRVHEENPLIAVAVTKTNGEGDSGRYTDLYTFALNITGAPDWSFMTRYAGQTAGQLIAAGNAMFCASDLDSIYSVSYDGKVRWRFELPDPINSLSVMGENLLFAGTGSGLFRVQNGQLAGLPFPGEYRDLISVNQQLIGLRDGQIHIMANMSGNPEDVIAREFQPVTPRESEASRLWTADLGNDNRVELLTIAVSSGDQWKLYAYNPDGTMVRNYPIPLQGDYSGTSIAVIGVSGGEVPEVYLNNGDGQIFGYPASGRLPVTFPIDVGEGSASAFAVTSFTGEQAALFYPGESGMLSGYRLRDGQEVPADMFQWQSEHGGPGQQRRVVISDDPVPPGEELAIERAYIYPNPVNEAGGTIRVEAAGGERISMNIYDFSGRPVYHWEQELIGSNTIVEHHWETGELPSGVYFGQVTVSGETGEKRELIKIALVR